MISNGYEPPTFEAQLADATSSLAVAQVEGTSTLLVAFGGIVGALGIPPFEFFNLTRGFDVGRVYVRDLRQSWYHAGLPGASDDARGTARVLADLVTRARRVVFVGNSMGGYAALLFGALLDATEVHAFSPQTFIDAATRARFGDARWPAQIARVHETGDRSLFDLLPLLRTHDGRCRFTVHYSPADPLDQLHAERLSVCDAVTLRSYEVGGHGVIKHLRDSGELERIIRGATAPAPSRT